MAAMPPLSVGCVWLHGTLALTYKSSPSALSNGVEMPAGTISAD